MGFGTCFDEFVARDRDRLFVGPVVQDALHLGVERDAAGRDAGVQMLPGSYDHRPGEHLHERRE